MSSIKLSLKFLSMNLIITLEVFQLLKLFLPSLPSAAAAAVAAAAASVPPPEPVQSPKPGAKGRPRAKAVRALAK